jgi:hypothetical protein
MSLRKPYLYELPSAASGRFLVDLKKFTGRKTNSSAARLLVASLVAKPTTYGYRLSLCLIGRNIDQEPDPLNNGVTEAQWVNYCELVTQLINLHIPTLGGIYRDKWSRFGEFRYSFNTYIMHKELNPDNL